jgi:hypothetical protein
VQLYGGVNHCLVQTIREKLMCGWVKYFGVFSLDCNMEFVMVGVVLPPPLLIINKK